MNELPGRRSSTGTEEKQRKGPRHGRWRRRRGYSMVELVISVSLVGLAALLFGSLYPTASRNAHASGTYSKAMNAAEHKAEQLRVLGYGRLNYQELLAAGIIDSAPGAAPYRFEQVDRLAQILPGATGTIDFQAAGADLAQATVRINWADPSGRQGGRTYSVSLLVANN